MQSLFLEDFAPPLILNEKQIAETNSFMDENIETVFLLANKKYGMISSSIVRQIFINNGNIDPFTPKAIHIT